ncbi:MAG: lysophospholipid acyltransferase family protein [Deltaproteobacteria bacterium]|nr:lysophospholipid acyltransferase family protein [Deltaproteobacteria bacterium]MBW1994009.1 lysophospholipid acyltransferase family protein [Deltaproteobacteria bacterium]MBW2150840.1 lysophospholipid acyltransferase family protein [Deltaproteobacteria bacterium]
MKLKHSPWVSEFKWRLIGAFGKWFIDLLFFSTRIESVGLEAVKPVLYSRRVIGAFWHSRILLVSYIFKGWNASILVSASDDGEYIARIIKRQGHKSIRGSTTKSGLRALAAMIRCLNRGQPGVVIPDGPQGPRFKVQPGVITLAKKTGCAILPISYSARKIKVFNSWDRFILPYPFTTCRIIYGNPIYVPEDADKELESRCQLKLESELRRITEDVDAYFGHIID